VGFGLRKRLGTLWGLTRNILAFIGSVWIVLTIYFVFFYND
jgi:hypothetical protein